MSQDPMSRDATGWESTGRDSTDHDSTSRDPDGRDLTGWDFPSWDPERERTPLEFARWGDISLRKGDRVRLRPRGGADALDLLLRGRTATIASIEQDYEDRIYLAVTVDDDPGRDLGAQRQPGHRFFFSPLEVEPLDAEGTGDA